MRSRPFVAAAVVLALLAAPAASAPAGPAPAALLDDAHPLTPAPELANVSETPAGPPTGAATLVGCSDG